MCQGDATSIICSEFTGNKWKDAEQRTWNSLQAGSTDTNSPAISVSYGKGNSDSRTDKHWYRWDIKAIAKKWVGNNNCQDKGVVFRLSNSTYENNSKYAYYMKTFSSMQGNANYKPYFYLSYNDSYTPVTNVRFSISSLTLEEKETYTFHPIVTPSTATNQQFTWTSSNENVATVSSSGKVTAKEAGTTTIKARSKANSSAEATCKVTVKLADSDGDGIIDSNDPYPNDYHTFDILSNYILADEWGAKINVKDKYYESVSDPISYYDTIVIHHTVRNINEDINSLQQNEINDGFNGIPYHYVISGDGTVYETRPLTVKGEHCGKNTGKIGVALMGNFEPSEINLKTLIKDANPTEPTDEQLNSMLSLIKILRTQYSVDYVIGHRDVVETACPGATLYDYLIKENILIFPEAS